MEKTHQPPRRQFSEESDLVGYCLDRAVTTFGLSLESAVREATKNSKSEKESERRALVTVNKWLSSGPKGKKLRGQFRDPTAR